MVMTAAAKEFVTPLSAATLSGHAVRDDLFSLTDEAQIGHIELSRAADLVVVAPATANLLARMAARSLRRSRDNPASGHGQEGRWSLRR